MSREEVLIKALKEISYLDRFILLREQYCSLKAPAPYADRNSVIEIIKSFGYEVKFISKGRFYKIESMGNVRSSLHFADMSGRAKNKQGQTTFYKNFGK